MSINLLDSVSFTSLRFFALITHFTLTPVLIWTRFDAVSVSLKPKYSRADYDTAEEAYLGLLGFGITVLIFELLFLALSYHHVDMVAVFHLFMDSLACFFVAWIALDALDWRNYIYVLVFCVLLPAIVDIVKYFFFVQKNLWVSWRKAKTVFETVLQSYRFATATAVYNWNNARSYFTGAGSVPVPTASTAGADRSAAMVTEDVGGDVRGDALAAAAAANIEEDAEEDEEGEGEGGQGVTGGEDASAAAQEEPLITRRRRRRFRTSASAADGGDNDNGDRGD